MRSSFLAQRWVATLLAIVVPASLLTGCSSNDNVLQGLHVARDDGPSSARFRIEAELIPNAQRVREDTTPQWELGRYAFKRGADRLLVISRITSVLVPTTPGPRRPWTKLKRADHSLERVWITIPYGTQIGEDLKLEELEDRFLVGYDEGEPHGEMFVQPNRVLGTLVLLEEKPNEIVIDINMRVEPKRMPSWDVNQRKMPIQITPSGVRAKAVRGSPITEYHAAESTAVAPNPPTSEPMPTHTDTVVPSDTGTGSPDVQDQPGPGVSTADATADHPTTQPADTQTIVGKWLANTNRFEYRFQFNADGKYVYGNTRGGGAYAPVMQYGTYRLKDNVLILEIKRYEISGKDTIGELNGKTIYSYRVNWVEGDLVIDGHFVRARQDNRVQLKRAYFPDMNYVLPPRGRSGDYQF